MPLKIPRETIIRLSYYLRALTYFLWEEKREFISSNALADFLNMSAEQVRKDLSYFGNFGKKGIGYRVTDLLWKLREILGLEREWRACVVGFGNLAKALSFYRGFQEQGIFIKDAFDVDKKKIGRKFGNVRVHHIDELEEVIRRENIEIGIVTVPRQVASQTIERLVKSGIKAILNFTPVRGKSYPNVVIKDVDLSCQLAYLTYYLKKMSPSLVVAKIR